MLQECIKIFETSPDIDKLIFDSYTPAEGTYVFLEEHKDSFNINEVIEVKQDRRTKDLNITEEEKNRISYYDYHSKLVDMNKPIDPKKTIQSNNYLSFWIKKESLTNGKLTQEKIDTYYDILSDPLKKYTKKDKELYNVVHNQMEDINQEKLQKISSWINDNIFNLPLDIQGKDYLKLFFICDGVSFEDEGKRYTIPNVYNKNEYNVKVGERVLGLPNENMGLNSKKPYLENKSRKLTVPFLVDTEQIIVRKKFFDYLWNLASSGKYNIYFDIKENKIYPFDHKSSPNTEFSGYYIRIRKDKNEAAIIDMDLITSFQPEVRKPLFVDNVIGVDLSRLKDKIYGRTTKLSEIREIINDVFFSKFLNNNLFNEPGDISINDTILKESILLSRNVLINWFYKGYDSGVINILDKVSINLIKNSIINNYLDKAQHQFNLRLALLEYFEKGDKDMADVMKEVRNTLRDKINSKEYRSIDCDKEYYYAVGQLMRYFITLNKSAKKNHSLFNPLLNITSDKQLKEKIQLFFKKYNYVIKENDLRFNNLYTLITSYQPETKIETDYMIAGYISNSLIYEKKEEN